MAVSKQTLSSGYALRLGLFTAINPWHCAITITYLAYVFCISFNIVSKSIHVQVFTVTSILFTHKTVLGEGIVSHIFPCSPQGGKISQLKPTCCMGKTILGGTYMYIYACVTDNSSCQCGAHSGLPKLS